MKIAIFAPTARGFRLALSLLDGLPEAKIWTKPAHAEALKSANTGPSVTRVITGSLAEAVQAQWSQVDCCLLIVTVGAAVRLIAPLLTDKSRDPGVVTVDQSGRWVVSLTGGHQGGADAWARQIAALLGVTPVITSASEGQELPSLDLLGDPYGWQKGSGDWTTVMAAVVAGDPVAVTQTCGWDLWRQGLPEQHSLVFGEGKAQARLWISDGIPPADGIPTVAWHPRTLWLGVGCERNTPADLIEQGIRAALQSAELAFESIAGLATIELKQDEEGLLALCQHYGWPLRLFGSDQLAARQVPHPSEVVRAAVGSPSVAEAAALCAAQAETLVVTKQITSGSPGACTVAIARAAQDYNPRQGSLALVGTGPGDLTQLTAAARVAITQADVVVGYGLYLDLIQPLWHPGQVIEASPITQEVQRADRAIQLARRGLRVAVVSSGDIGIYGMGGLVLERLSQSAPKQAAQKQAAQKDQDPAAEMLVDVLVEVFPGVSAFQAAAARLGAPLMHDFCCISLSDLLTPWPVIENRLQAAAQGDFVVAFYNPRSQRRTVGIRQAQAILLQHRDPDTPVAIARSLYRDGESIHITTLGQMDPETIDMLTLVLVGNSSSFIHPSGEPGQGQPRWIITPRGYADKKPG